MLTLFYMWMFVLCPPNCHDLWLIKTYRESMAASCTVAPLASMNGKFVAKAAAESFFGSFRLRMLVMVKLVYPELPDDLLLSIGISAGLSRDDSDMVLIMMRFVIEFGTDVEVADWNFIRVPPFKSGCGECSGLETTFISISKSWDDIFFTLFFVSLILMLIAYFCRRICNRCKYLLLFLNKNYNFDTFRRFDFFFQKYSSHSILFFFIHTNISFSFLFFPFSIFFFFRKFYIRAFFSESQLIQQKWRIFHTYSQKWYRYFYSPN